MFKKFFKNVLKSIRFVNKVADNAKWQTVHTLTIASMVLYGSKWLYQGLKLVLKHFKVL